MMTMCWINFPELFIFSAKRGWQANAVTRSVITPFRIELYKFMWPESLPTSSYIDRFVTTKVRRMRGLAIRSVSPSHAWNLSVIRFHTGSEYRAFAILSHGRGYNPFDHARRDTGFRLSSPSK